MCENGNFGITFHFWDHVFATFYGDPKTRPRSASVYNLGYDEGEAGRYQAFQIGWSGRVDPDGNSYIFHKCKAPQNVGGFCDKDVDAWLDQARLINKFEERKALYEKVARKVLDEENIIYLYHQRILVAHTDRLTGYKQVPDGIVRVVGISLK